MLKHVHLSSSGLLPYRCRTPARDTVSLNSTLSFSSNGGHDPLSSRSSSTSSLHDVNLSPKPPKVVVKVYARVLSVDVEYKTLSIGPQTTSKEVVRMLLNKFRMKHRDPNLYYLAMEVWIRKTGLPIRTIMVLDDDAKPAELQACHPRSEIRFFHSTPPVCRFLLQMRRGGLVKVYDSCLMTGSLYKSLLVSDRTTTEEVIQLLLHCYNSKERPNKFSLFEISSVQKYERKLHQHDYPLLVQQEWLNREEFSFHLRKNSDCLVKRKLLWIRSTSPSGQQSFRLRVKDEVSPTAIHSPTLKPSFNNYDNVIYI